MSITMMKTNSLLFLSLAIIALSLCIGGVHSVECTTDLYCQQYTEFAPYGKEMICVNNKCQPRQCYHAWDCSTLKCNPNGRCSQNDPICDEEWCRLLYGSESTCLSQDIFDCEKIYCEDDTECPSGFECTDMECINSECAENECTQLTCEGNILSNRSKCPDGYQCDYDKNYCIEKQCTEKSDCTSKYGPNATCDTDTGECIKQTCDVNQVPGQTCPYGYECDKSQHICVKWLECDVNSDCRKYYGSNSVCTADKTCSQKLTCDASDEDQAVCSNSLLTCVGTTCIDEDIWHRDKVNRNICTRDEACQGLTPYGQCFDDYFNRQAWRDFSGQCYYPVCTVATSTEPDSCPENFECNAKLKHCYPKRCSSADECSGLYTCNPHTNVCEIHCLSDNFCEDVYGPGVTCSEDGYCIGQNSATRCINDNKCRTDVDSRIFESTCDKDKGECTSGEDIICNEEICQGYYGVDSTCGNDNLCTIPHLCVEDSTDPNDQCPEDMTCNRNRCVIAECTSDDDCLEMYGEHSSCNLRNFLCKAHPCGYPGYAECPTGTTCVENTCIYVPRCQEDVDCFGEYGINATCDNSDPLAEPVCNPQTCSKTADCPQGLECKSIDGASICVRQTCTNNTDCFDKYSDRAICDGDTKVCIPKSCKASTAVKDCSNGFECSSENICTPLPAGKCIRNDDCQTDEDEECIDNTCIVPRCKRNSDCFGEYGKYATCDRSNLSNIVCQPQTCSELVVCPDGLECKITGSNISGICVRQTCSKNADCFDQYSEQATCDTVKKTCVPKTCHVDILEDCPNGYKCVDDNTCTPLSTDECVKHGDCPTDADCVENICIVPGCREDSDCFEDYGRTATCDHRDKFNVVCAPQVCFRPVDCPGGLECKTIDDSTRTVCVHKECKADKDCSDEYGTGSTCNTTLSKCTPKTCTTSDDCSMNFICNDNQQCEKNTIQIKLVTGTMSRKFTGVNDREHRNAQQRFSRYMQASTTCKPLHNDIIYGHPTVAYYVSSACESDEVKAIQNSINAGVTTSSAEATSEDNLSVQQQQSSPVKVSLSLKKISNAVPRECFADVSKAQCDTETCTFACINSAVSQSLMIAFVLAILVSILC